MSMMNFQAILDAIELADVVEVGGVYWCRFWNYDDDVLELATIDDSGNELTWDYLIEDLKQVTWDSEQKGWRMPDGNLLRFFNLQQVFPKETCNP